MGRLQMKVAECKYKRNDRGLKEQFINGTNDEFMTNETSMDLTSKTPVV